MSLVGFINNLQIGDPFAGLPVCNTDTAGDVRYYGAMALNGVWKIMREDATDSTLINYAYTYGTTGYAAAWADRAVLTYTYPDGTSL